MSRRVAVIIPTLNEAATIGGLLAQLGRLPAGLVTEILVADGRSTDRTRDIVAAAARGDPRIRLIDNPARLQAAGVNRAAARADRAADTLVRIDAHAAYPDDYVPRIVATFARTDADMVATRLASRGRTCAQRGIAAAMNSRIGSGGSAHRSGGASGFVDHGHHAGMDRAAFEAAGGYDESFAANEDAELDLRIRRAGGRIWFAADIVADYFPRATLRRLAAQYHGYGRGRARTWLKHREPLRPRQLAAPALVAGSLAAVLAAPFAPQLLLGPLLYAVLIAAATLGLLRREPGLCTLYAAPAAVTMHFAWGWAFIVTVLAEWRPAARGSVPTGRLQLEDKQR